LGILSVFYKVGLSVRRFIYDRGLKQTKTLPTKVISIGNLTLGGTGKTPAVIALAEEAKKRGFNPCILTRGYGGKAKGPCFVKGSNELRVTSNIKGSNELKTKYSSLPSDSSLMARHSSLLYGDETLLMAERLKDVPVVKCRDRYKGGIFALNLSLVTDPSLLLFILDDGFQHWRLHRDLDILLIDATDPFGNERLFPEGRLREPLDSIKRADIIVITKADMIDMESTLMITERIKQYNPHIPVYTASHKPVSLINASGETNDIDSLKNKNIYAFAGIANPAYFKAILLSIGANVVRFKTFRDHYKYRQQDIGEIIKKADGLEIVTTEKDMVKLKDFKLSENIYALRIDFSIEDAFYNYIFRRIQC